MTPRWRTELIIYQRKMEVKEAELTDVVMSRIPSKLLHSDCSYAGWMYWYHTECMKCIRNVTKALHSGRGLQIFFRLLSRRNEIFSHLVPYALWNKEKNMECEVSNRWKTTQDLSLSSATCSLERREKPKV